MRPYTKVYEEDFDSITLWFTVWYKWLSKIQDQYINPSLSYSSHQYYKGWLQYPTYCVSSSDADLTETAHPIGDRDIDKCKSECDRIPRCSAIEWNMLPWRPTKCHLILGDIPATKGFSGDVHRDRIICHVKPTYENGISLI